MGTALGVDLQGAMFHPRSEVGATLQLSGMSDQIKSNLTFRPNFVTCWLLKIGKS